MPMLALCLLVAALVAVGSGAPASFAADTVGQPSRRPPPNANKSEHHEAKAKATAGPSWVQIQQHEHAHEASDLTEASLTSIRDEHEVLTSSHTTPFQRPTKHPQNPPNSARIQPDAELELPKHAVSSLNEPTTTNDTLPLAGWPDDMDNETLPVGDFYPPGLATPTSPSSPSPSSFSSSGTRAHDEQQPPMPDEPPIFSPDSNQSSSPVFFDTPQNRRLLAKYILTEFHEIDLNSVLDKTPGLLEASRREVFGPVISETLLEAGVTNQSTDLNATLIPASIPPALHRPYYGDVFESFQTMYWPLHCVTGLVICTLGIFANLINVIVLTRPNMISAVNTILCAIACSDLIVNLSNIPYLMHELADASNESAYYSHNWAHYILLHAHLTVTSHTISIWLTCALATWRYCVIRSQSSNKRNWSVGLAVRVIIGVALLVPVFCIPNYLSFAIVREQTEKNATIYKVGFSSLADDSQFIKTFHFWIFSCLTKLLPCLLLTYFTTVLIKLLSNARERRIRLTNNLTRTTDGYTSATSKASIPNGFKSGSRRKASDEIARRRASDDEPEKKRRRQAAAKDGANGFELRSSLLRFKRKGSLREKTAGEQHNLQLLAKDMRKQMNVLVIKEAGSISSSSPKGDMAGHSLDEDGQAGLQQDSLGDSLNQQRVAPPHERGTRPGAVSAMSPRDNSASPNCRLATENNSSMNDDNMTKSNQHAFHAHSGSSCATDAECLQVTGSSSSHSSASFVALIDHSAAQQPKPSQQPQQQLLVETIPDSGKQAVSSATTTRALALTSDDRLGLIGVGGVDDKEQLDKTQAAPRSSSTGGALELYAVKNDNGKSQSRVTLANASGETRINMLLNDRFAPSHAVHLGSPARQPEGGTNSGSSILHTNQYSVDQAESGNKTKLGELKVGHHHHGAGTQLQADRPRSIGSATFAPLQIVRFQATHRQLSQNETTTRLLIAVIIVFLICEFPAGILAALCAILGQDFFDNVYQPMGSLTDMLALINSSVNFILYCFMSTQFRVTFYRVVLHCPAPREINQ